MSKCSSMGVVGDYTQDSPSTNELSWLGGIMLPASLTGIDNYAFDGAAFTEIEIPYSVTYINEHAFNRCTQMISLTLPHDLQQIDNSAFSGLTQNCEVYYNGTQEEWENISGYNNLPSTFNVNYQ